VDLVANTWREVTLAFGEDNYGYGWMWGKEPEVFTNIDSIGFSFDAQGSAFTLLIDDLYFMKCKWRGSAEDSGGGSSQALYGQRDTYYVDDTLKSNADCTSRAERLLYQQKSLPNRIDMEVKGNTAIGVGDRLSLTIPAEDIPPTNYDVLSVEHNFLKGGGLTTSASFINSGDIRALPPAVPNDSIRKHFDVQREVGKGLRVIK
jgi:hypothetical protein